jgi:hypothetical protein
LEIKNQAVKRRFLILASAILCSGTVATYAQFGMGSGSSPMSDSTQQLFGSNQVFSATLSFDIHTKGKDQPMTVSGKLFFDNGNSRFEMDMTEITGGQLESADVAQMKTLGLDRMAVISVPDKKAAFLIYPNVQSYVEITVQDADSTATNRNFKIETSELGNETVDGHACVKNKVTVMDKQGILHEFTVWNATDLNNFPIQIQQTQQNTRVSIAFKDISFSKPDAGLFAAPPGFTRYGDAQTLMQQAVMKRMGNTQKTSSN